MKNLKLNILVTLLIISPVFSMSQQTDKAKIASAANDYVVKLTNDVNLTEIQKEKLKQCVIVYFTKMTNAQKQTNKVTKKNDCELAEFLFTQQSDSILSSEQREIIQSKSIIRAENSSKKNN